MARLVVAGVSPLYLQDHQLRSSSGATPTLYTVQAINYYGSVVKKCLQKQEAAEDSLCLHFLCFYSMIGLHHLLLDYTNYSSSYIEHVPKILYFLKQSVFLLSAHSHPNYATPSYSYLKPNSLNGGVKGSKFCEINVRHSLAGQCQ